MLNLYLSFQKILQMFFVISYDGNHSLT